MAVYDKVEIVLANSDHFGARLNFEIDCVLAQLFCMLTRLVYTVYENGAIKSSRLQNDRRHIGAVKRQKTVVHDGFSPGPVVFTAAVWSVVFQSCVLSAL